VTETTTVSASATAHTLYARWDTATLTVDKTLLTLAQTANSADTFTVGGNVAWSATAQTAGLGAGWLSVTPASAAANATTTVTIKTTAANTTGAPRTGVVQITAAGAGASITRTVFVTQRAAASGTGAAPTGGTLPTGATLTFNFGAQGTETYTVAAGGKLTPVSPAGADITYEYEANGNTGTLLFDDSVWSLNFATRTFHLYATYADGTPYDLEGTFAYTVLLTLNANATGATVTPATKQVSPGRPYDTLPTPTRSGYTFSGWFANPAGTGAQTTEATTVSANAAAHTLYAKWSTSGGGGTGGGGGGNSSGGGGGGGAPMPLALALMALAVVARLVQRRR
jgi:uncharacterized repeat protein (TIGR02543 family)